VQRKIVNKPVQKEKVQPKLRPKTQPKQPRKSRTIRKNTNVINTNNDNTEKSTNTRNTRNSKRLSSKKIEMEQQEQIEKMKIMAMNAKKHSTTEEKSTFNIDKPTVSNYSAIHVHESNGREILETRTTDHPSDQSERKSSEIETVEKVTVSTVTEELLTKTPKNSTQNKNHNKQENGKENNKSSTQELMNSAASKLFFHVGLSEKDLNYSPITNLDTSRENLDQDQNSKNSLQNTPKINSKSRQDTNLTAAENKNKIANERSPTPTPTKNPNNSPITQNSNNFEGVDPSSPSPCFGQPSMLDSHDISMLKMREIINEFEDIRAEYCQIREEYANERHDSGQSLSQITDLVEKLIQNSDLTCKINRLDVMFEEFSELPAKISSLEFRSDKS